MRLTLLRPPVVRRQQSPLSGSASAFACWRSRPRESRADFIALCRCTTEVSAPHPSCGSVTNEAATAQRQEALGDLEPSRDPHAILGHEGAAGCPCAREPQERGRGSPRPSCSAFTRSAGMGIAWRTNRSSGVLPWTPMCRSWASSPRQRGENERGTEPRGSPGERFGATLSDYSMSPGGGYRAR